MREGGLLIRGGMPLPVNRRSCIALEQAAELHPGGLDVQFTHASEVKAGTERPAIEVTRRAGGRGGEGCVACEVELSGVGGAK